MKINKILPAALPKKNPACKPPFYRHYDEQQILHGLYTDGERWL